MAALNVPYFSTTFTADGTSAGVVTIADTTKVTVGAVGYVSSATIAAEKVQITAILSATTMTVRRVFEFNSGVAIPPNYGNSDVSAYKVANTATFVQSRQTLIVDNTDVTTPQVLLIN